MNQAAGDGRGLEPLAPYLAQIGAMRSKRDLPRVLGQLQLAVGSGGMFFGFDANQDFADSSSVIAFVGAGGLGLPDRDYYTKDDAKSKEIRTQYVAHVERMFGLLG